MNHPRLRKLVRWPTRLIVIKLAAFCLAFSVAADPLSPHPSDTTVATSTREGRLAVFDDVWTTVNERYYDRNFSSLARGLSWESQRAIFRAQVMETNSPPELYAVLRKMLASLNDPHARVFAPGEKYDWWRPRFVTTGLTIREVSGFPTVVKVESDSAPHRAGVVPGDVIESVNRVPALGLIQRKLSEYAMPTSQLRSRIFATLVDGPAQTVVELTWRRKDGQKTSAQFRRYWLEKELGLRVRKDHGMAIVDMDGFTGETARNFIMALNKSSREARGVVLDLRANGGGDSEAMTDVASTLLGTGYGLGRFVDRAGTQLSLVTRRRSPFIANRILQTNLPVIVLTSERTSSAAEILVAGLRASGRANIIGTATCGCVLAIRTRHQLPDGGLLDVSELDYHTPSGQRLEKQGIKPDETVMVERSDLYSGHDRALELAIRKLKLMSAPTAGFH
jgi:C-terminal peptidase prc